MRGAVARSGREAQLAQGAWASRARAAAVSGKEAPGGWLCLAGARLAALPHGAVFFPSDALGQACAAGFSRSVAGALSLCAVCREMRGVTTARRFSDSPEDVDGWETSRRRLLTTLKRFWKTRPIREQNPVDVAKIHLETAFASRKAVRALSLIHI